MLEYAGELLSKEEADRREIRYNQTGCGSYMFYFKHKGQDLWCVIFNKYIFYVFYYLLFILN